MLIYFSGPYTTIGNIFDPIRSIFDPVQHENTPARVINSFLSPFHDSAEDHGPEFHDHKSFYHHRDPTAWWEDSTTTPLIQNIFNDITTVKSDHDSNTPTDILGQENEFKANESQHGSGIKSGVASSQTSSAFGSTDQTVNVNHSSEIKGEVKKKDTTPDGKKILKAITKKHIYFQAETVRPEGENKRANETIYYVNN